jgi:hypothetical protein
MYNGIQGNCQSEIMVSDGSLKMLVYFDDLPSTEQGDFKWAKQHFGYFINKGSIPRVYYIYTGENKEILKTTISIRYNTLNEGYIKHKLERKFKVEFFENDKKMYPIQHPHYQPNPFALKYVIATKNDDERRREASPERLEYIKTALRSRSPSRFKPKKKSKKLTKKSTKKVTKKKSKK